MSWQYFPTAWTTSRRAFRARLGVLYISRSDARGIPARDAETGGQRRAGEYKWKKKYGPTGGTVVSRRFTRDGTECAGKMLFLVVVDVVVVLDVVSINGDVVVVDVVVVDVVPVAVNCCRRCC